MNSNDGKRPGRCDAFRRGEGAGIGRRRFARSEARGAVAGDPDTADLASLIESDKQGLVE